MSIKDSQNMACSKASTREKSPPPETLAPLTKAPTTIHRAKAPPPEIPTQKTTNDQDTYTQQNPPLQPTDPLAEK